ncbi:MAG: DEDD exonuclease domain-containing protein [Ancrocorticia sp.]|uniref:DEDD exonuclease domain-containing protein n=2 Tax=Ancrocorticia sp. TaxID=2593684 RepID=UPI003F8FEBE2
MKASEEKRAGRLDLGMPVGQSAQMAFEDLGASLERVTFVVVDLETTGGAPTTHSITEFGAVKVCGGETVGEFATLVNPGVPIPPFITALTGISTAMVMDAPDIGAVMPAFLEFLGDSPDTVLVAHNARFDVSHLKAAAAGLSMAWPRVRVADTVKLARRAFTKDETPNYKLGTLARLCGATVTPTHRALDDARATVDVLHAILARLGPLGVTHIEDLATASDPVPPARRAKVTLAANLPHTPGVYRFIGPDRAVMYVGTSVNVYKRVRQYFTAAEKRKRMAEMVDLAVSVEATSTATQLEASILELRQIIEFDPPYNRRSRHPEKRPWLTLTDEPHPQLKATRNLSFDKMDTALGPFSSLSAAKRVSELISDCAHLRSCTQKLPERPGSGASACHLLSMGKCDGPCINSGADSAAVERASAALGGGCDWIWEAQMERLAALARAERFEQAATERDRVASLMSVSKRKERLIPMLTAPEIIAAAREKHGWEIAVIRYGRLVGTVVARAGQDVPLVAEALAESCPAVSRPDIAGGAAHIEESDILLGWLWRDNTRLLEFDGERPLALARRSPARHRVPKQAPLPALH